MPWTKADDNPAYHTAAWRRARERALRNAEWKCEIRLEGCAGAASQVDHVDGIAADPGHTNLRASCVPCHRKVTAQQGGGYRGKPKPDPRPAPRTQW
jgi:hypothetical protein